MTKEETAAVIELIAHAEGLIEHRNHGDCPDAIFPADRSLNCPVCQALIVMDKWRGKRASN